MRHVNYAVCSSERVWLTNDTAELHYWIEFSNMNVFLSTDIWLVGFPLYYSEVFILNPVFLEFEPCLDCNPAAAALIWINFKCLICPPLCNHPWNDCSRKYVISCPPSDVRERTEWLGVLVIFKSQHFLLHSSLVLFTVNWSN